MKMARLIYVHWAGKKRVTMEKVAPLDKGRNFCLELVGEGQVLNDCLEFFIQQGEGHGGQWGEY